LKGKKVKMEYKRKYKNTYKGEEEFAKGINMKYR
jgi:hypothetical protein